MWILGGYSIGDNLFDDLWTINVDKNSNVTWTWVEGSKEKDQKSIEPPGGNKKIFSIF